VYDLEKNLYGEVDGDSRRVVQKLCDFDVQSG
jgi:hypothetical protein